MVVAHGGVEGLGAEKAIEKQVQSSVAGGGIGILLLHFADGLCPRGEVVEVEPIGVFGALAVVHGKLC